MQDNLQDSMIPLAVLRDNQIMPESTGEVLDKELLVGKLILASNIITIVLTFLPVALDFPSIYRNEWFGIADIIRLAEPLIILSINMALFLQGITEPVIMERKSQSRTILLIIWFGFSAALYQQGAGYHSASAMFKAVIRDVRDEAALKAIDPGVNLLILDAYNYARDTWEHTISHYMYAIGGLLLSFLYAFMFRKLGSNNLSRLSIVLWGLCVLTYGVIIAAVAIQYPYGAILGFVLTILYGFGILGFYLKRKPGWKVPGRYVMIQHYIASYMIALVILIPWCAIYGIKGRNNGAGF